MKKSSNHLLLFINNKLNFKSACRFQMFVRIRPGYISPFKDQQRTWCFRGDKYTQEEPKMLRNLLNLLKNKLELYDRIEIYDKNQTLEDQTIIKIVDGVVSINKLQHYSTMLEKYPLPAFLKP